ncbi:glycosyltransferase [Demequina sp. NBRC 110053]|uniref:glycosyltransferase n=1 Tax=Demequina sp. NBRC 110053 TaxID=1570342 RepID=UPI0013564D76|nr:glycosyltransferase [Demequina sp. NBRC 110053]
MTAVEQAEAEQASEVIRRVVHRVVLPPDADPDTLPLYVDFTMARAEEKIHAAVAPAEAGAEVTGRRSLRLNGGAEASFGAYFSAFPAGYWRRWTDVAEVRLSVRLSGAGTIAVHKSNARGNAQRVRLVRTDDGVIDVDLSLAPFGDGGWYWFDLYASDGDVTLESAEWSVDGSYARKVGTASIAITTFNRPDYCVAQLHKLGQDQTLTETVDRIYVVDQGNQLVQDQPDFEEAAARLGERLAVVRQGNLGGSGGFSRGMTETLEAGDSDYVMLLDDDIVSEPEGIVRAVAFGDFARTPTIVGGHMFSMYEKSTLHAFGERVNRYSFWWGGLENTEERHDFSLAPLRTTPWLHQRVDVDYNGWWMCLIPVEALRAVGLSLPVFIKWDDAEYCLRAADAGIPTVSLPGAAVWHVPWVDKDDAIDWQAYYHQRNRWLAAMLHSPYNGGGALPRVSFTSDVKHLLQLQYSAVELRLKALEDLLEGPEHLHATIGTTLPEVRALRAQFTDAVIEKDPGAFPLTRRHRPPSRGKLPSQPKGAPAALASALTGALKQLRSVRPQALEIPEERIATTAAKWWRLSHLDSAVVTSADGTGASMYVRDPKKFRAYLRRSARLHQRLARQWGPLSRQYRAAMPAFTSPEEWRVTFAANAVDDQA